jgi:hypothetical protein
MARHMSLPSNSHPDQIMNQGDILEVSDSNANPSASTLGRDNSEDDLATQKIKKKGVMSLFKRNK